MTLSASAALPAWVVESDLVASVVPSATALTCAEA
jgi:hypothetical protein